MNSTLDGRTILLLSSNFGTEAAEIRSPLDALRDAGATVTVAAPETGVVRTLEHDRDPGPEIPVDAAHDTVRAADFDALVLPGGALNADSLRGDETAKFLARAFAADGKPVAAICHAPWLLVEKGLADGRQLTSVPTLRTVMVNTRARLVDQWLVGVGSVGLLLSAFRHPLTL